MIVTVRDPALTMLRIEVNGRVLPNGDDTFIVEHNDKVEVFFEPWKVTPLVRFNGHMVNYKAARIHQFDHMLKFVVNEDYLTPYYEQLIQFKMDFLNRHGSITAEDIDSFIGVDVDCSQLINEIKQKIA